jgi:hypothetical protein
MGLARNPIFSDKGKTLEAGDDKYYETGMAAGSNRR